jgi:hypothetical protein
MTFKLCGTGTGLTLRYSARPAPHRTTAFPWQDFVALLAGVWRPADLAIAELCDALARIASLRTLDLRSVWGDAKAIALAGALPKMASLMTLHLGGTSSLSFELPCVGVSMPRPIRG